MSIQMKINDLANRRALVEQGGGEAAINKIHSAKGLTARERVIKLLDTNSFVEVGAFVKPRATDFNMMQIEAPADGVITGYGAIEGRLVYVYSQDRTVLSGSLGEMHSKKIINIYNLAFKMGAPVIALIDSAGLRLQESLDALDGFGHIFEKQALLSGILPQITAVLGNCGGGTAILPSMSDFTFMTSKNSSLYVNAAHALDIKIDQEDMSSAKFHSEVTGLIDFVYETEEEVIEGIRRLMVMLPLNNHEDASVVVCEDDPNRSNDLFNEALLSAKEIIEEIVDADSFIEIGSLFGKDVVIGLGKMNGMTVGLMGNQSSEGLLSIDGIEKMSDFVIFCDAYNIPMVTITNVCGFEPTIKAERLGVSRRIAKLTYAFSNANTSKVNVIVGKAIGSAYVVQNSKHIGADLVYAWPTAEIATMHAESAVRIMYADAIDKAEVSSDFIKEQTAIYKNNESSPYVAASRGYVDNIIEPAATRKRVIAALEMLYTKRHKDVIKKHGTV